MIFTTYWFLGFTPLVVALFWAIPRAEWRWWLLALACLVFHAKFAGPAGMVPVLGLMVLTYAAGYSRNAWACRAVIAVNVLALAFYKYTLFLIGTVVSPISPALGEWVGHGADAVMPGLPPLGISFFAFEFVHYLFEIRRGADPIRNPLKFLLFSVFFPSLVAGPIKRYPQFIASLENDTRQFQLSNLSEGLRRIALGFGKKVLIADNLTVLIDHYQPQFATASLFDRWWLVLAIGFRILMDFSGYTDIAIGCARLFGIRLPENFNWPYLARNIQDFWQRWHMSLSTWIRDYIYIPLGGSRLGPLRRVSNGLIAFGLCGLWHGPAWNFVVWGLYHGVGLALCATYRKIPGLGPTLARIFVREPTVAWVLTQTFVFVGWIIFFYPVPEAWTMIQLLFRP